jgi:hypothetical protein
MLQLNNKKSNITKQITWRSFYKKALKKAMHRFIGNVFPITILNSLQEKGNQDFRNRFFLYDEEQYNIKKAFFYKIMHTLQGFSLFNLKTYEEINKNFAENFVNKKEHCLTESYWASDNKNNFEKFFLKKYSGFFKKKLYRWTFVPQYCIKSKKAKDLSLSTECSTSGIDPSGLLSDVQQDFIRSPIEHRLHTRSDKETKSSLLSGVQHDFITSFIQNDLIQQSDWNSNEYKGKKLLKKINLIKKHIYNIPLEKILFFNESFEFYNLQGEAGFQTTRSIPKLTENFIRLLFNDLVLINLLSFICCMLFKSLKYATLVF